MGEEEIKEAGWVAQSVAGASTYLYSIDYPLGKFKEELAAIVNHITKTKR